MYIIYFDFDNININIKNNVLKLHKIILYMKI